MNNRQQMSLVKLQVRQYAILLKEFSAEDIVKLTGLNPESVRTEIQRMKKDGYVVASGRRTKGKVPGSRPVTYKLVNDALKVLELTRNLEAFNFPTSRKAQPTSRHYFEAKKILDELTVLDEAQNQRKLDEVERSLQIAEQSEGGGNTPSDIRIYLTYEYGRLMFLRERYQEAKSLFEKLLSASNDIDDQLLNSQIRQFLIYVDIKINFSNIDLLDDIGSLQTLKDTISQSEIAAATPLALALLSVLEHILNGLSIGESTNYYGLRRKIERIDLPKILSDINKTSSPDRSISSTNISWCMVEEVPLQPSVIHRERK